MGGAGRSRGQRVLHPGAERLRRQGRTGASRPTARLRCHDCRRASSLESGGLRRRARRVYVADAAATPAAGATHGMELLELRDHADRAQRRADRRRNGVVGHARRRLPLRQPRRRLGGADPRRRWQPARRPRPVSARHRRPGALRTRPWNAPRGVRQPVQPRLRTGSAHGSGWSRASRRPRVRRLGCRLPQVRLVSARSRTRRAGQVLHGDARCVARQRPSHRVQHQPEQFRRSRGWTQVRLVAHRRREPGFDRPRSRLGR